MLDLFLKGGWVMYAILGTSVLALAPAFAWAGRPLVVDDAGTVPVKRWELEAGASYWGDSTTDHYEIPLALTYGLFSSLEMGASSGGQLEQRVEQQEESPSRREHVHDFHDVVLAGKWNFANDKTHQLSFAIAPAIKAPTADHSKGFGNGEVDYDLMLIASKTFSEKTAFHLNGGYTWIGDPEGEDLSDVLHYGVAFDHQVLSNLQIVGEIAANTFVSNRDENGVQYRCGCRWALTDALTLDAAYGGRISGETPENAATVGLTWDFEFSHSRR